MQTESLLQQLLVSFAAAECCWFSSVRPDGRVHSAPVWHVWSNGRAYVVTTEGAVKVANIAGNPHVVVALPDPLNVFIMEGQARLNRDALAGVAPMFEAKYDWNPLTDAGYSVLIEVAPTRIMAWGAHGEGRWTGPDVTLPAASAPASVGDAT